MDINFMVVNKKDVLCFLFFILITILLCNCTSKKDTILFIKSDFVKTKDLYSGFKVQYMFNGLQSSLLIEDSIFCTSINEPQLGIYIELRDSSKNFIQSKYHTALFLPPPNFEDSMADVNSDSILKEKYPVISNNKLKRDNNQWYNMYIQFTPNLSIEQIENRKIYLSIGYKDSSFFVQSNSIPLLFQK